MKVHAWKEEGRTYCGLESETIHAVDPRLPDGSIDEEQAGTVSCKSCQRYLGLLAAAPTPPAVEEESLRAVIREELQGALPDQLLKRRQVADMLGVGIPTVRKLIKKGLLSEIAVTKRKKRVRRSVVQAFIDERS